MLRFTIICLCTLIAYTTASSFPYLYNPYEDLYRYSSPHFSEYSNQRVLPYGPPFTNNEIVHDSVAAAYLATPDIMPTLNVLAEVPYSVSTRFTVVPMLVMSKDNMNMVSNAQIMAVSKERPIMTIKTPENNVLQCTPAVRIVLQKPMIVGSLKSSVVFPTEVQILHEGYRIPLQIGAVIAPVLPETYVSQQTPIAVRVVYAVPTRPINLNVFLNVPVQAVETDDKFNPIQPLPPQKPEYPAAAQPETNEDAVVISGQEAVAIDSATELPPKNVTIIDFPEKEAEPNLQVDEEDDELVNRNPPLVLAPAGIVQSTQPHAVVEPFHNPKESPVLSALREESKKRI